MKEIQIITEILSLLKKHADIGDNISLKKKLTNKIKLKVEINLSTMTDNKEKMIVNRTESHGGNTDCK